MLGNFENGSTGWTVNANWSVSGGEALYDGGGLTTLVQAFNTIAVNYTVEFEINDYAQPAGGCCFLTDAAYSDKLADLWQHRGNKNYELDDIMLLKVGRHIRPKQNFKMIVGREEGENNFLEGYQAHSNHPHRRSSNHRVDKDQ